MFHKKDKRADDDDGADFMATVADYSYAPHAISIRLIKIHIIIIYINICIKDKSRPFFFDSNMDEVDIMHYCCYTN